MSKPVASLKELKQYGSVKDGRCKIDVSRLPAEHAKNVIATIKTYSTTEFTGLEFTLDLLEENRRKSAQTQKSGSRGDKLAAKSLQMPIALQNSVVQRNKNITHEIVSMTCDAMNKSQELSFVKFRSFPFAKPDLELFCKTVQLSTNLRSLRLCDVPLKDRGFYLLCNALHHRSVTDLQCRKCELTDASGPYLRSLLSYHKFVQSEYDWAESLGSTSDQKIVCLQSIDLRDNEFTFEFINEVSDPLLDLQITNFDLRGNAGISASIVESLRINLNDKKGTIVKVGPSRLPKSPRPPKRATSAIRPRSSQSARIQQLEEENRSMRTLLNTLEDGDNIVELEPGLCICGPRADELVENIKHLDKMLLSYPGGPQPFLQETLRSQ